MQDARWLWVFFRDQGPRLFGFLRILEGGIKLVKRWPGWQEIQEDWAEGR
jgi:hypothetical protein